MKNKLLMTAIGITVSIIVLGAVLVPVLDDAQKSAGPATRYNNGVDGAYRLIESDGSCTIEMERNAQSFWTVTIDGVAYYLPDVQGNANLIYSDAITLNRNAAGSNLQVSTMAGDSSNSSAKSIVFEDGIMTYSIPSTSYVYSAPYTWAYILDPNGGYVNIGGERAYYVNSVSDVVASGYYSTGENDTYYELKNGISHAGEYESSVSYDLELVDGTTDIYKLSNLKIKVGNEEFTPYRVLVKSAIDGHESKGASYTIYGIIPVIVLVSIVLYAVQAVRTRDD